MNTLTGMLQEMEVLLPQFEKRNDKVSKASIGWQINHNLLVFNSVCKAIISSDPAKFKSKFNLTRTIILWSGIIPRKKAKAPKEVVSDIFTTESIQTEIANAYSLLKRLDTLDENAYFSHPFFGDINLKTTRRFLAVHTEHHLKIMRDILK